ncbi:MAG: S41 family peptidase [Pirellulaceae bacterium]
MPLRNVYIIVFAFFLAVLCHATARQRHSAMVVGQAVDLVNRYYVDPVDDRKLLEDAMSGMLQSLDRHTQYIPPDAYERFESFLQQEFAGIGILVEQPDPTEPVRVITPLFGSPALRAGLLPGDEIVKVDGVDVTEMSLNDVSERLRGPVNEEVLVGLRRGKNQQLTISVRRGQIALESVVGDHRDPDSGWVYSVRENPRIGYIRITSFGEKTASEVRDVLRELDNDFEGLVLDLRGNAGGLLNAAVSICDLFLDDGVIVTTQGRGGKLLSESKASKGTLVDLDKPVAILIDGESASASEIVAACLQDHQRAAIVGARSFGKGTVQNVLMMEYGRSALKLTTARYYRPSGLDIHRGPEDDEEDPWGVLPDPGLEVELSEEERKQLVRRWQRATYPVLDSDDVVGGDAEEPPPDEEFSEDDAPADDLNSDPQLQRAIEHLQARTHH